ncbi:MAG TPA: D-2-hydroxyacid dehydrogenase [Syntrophorhabdaceae bacterium]|nr:D-2-hydroxyacid dehydrogenase [Syntrophorhabdaceae bacterium]
MNLVIFVDNAETYANALRPGFPDLVIHAAPTEERLGTFVEDMDILLAFRISDSMLRKASKLKWIQSLATGVDYITSNPSLSPEVLITSTRGIHGPQVSEMAFLLMLSLSRNFPKMACNQCSATWERWPGKLLYNKNVGILGLGVIGREIARKCKAFGMTVYGIDIIEQDYESVDHFFTPQEILRVVKDIDYFITVAPSTPQTYHIIDKDVLSAMKSSAFFINIGRGELVDDDALIEALNTEKIAGAALDAFVREPLPSEHPFWKVKNLIITPHIGGASDTYVEQALPIFEENLRRFLKGERKDLINLVST